MKRKRIPLSIDEKLDRAIVLCSKQIALKVIEQADYGADVPYDSVALFWIVEDTLSLYAHRRSIHSRFAAQQIGFSKNDVARMREPAHATERSLGAIWVGIVDRLTGQSALKEVLVPYGVHAWEAA